MGQHPDWGKADTWQAILDALKAIVTGAQGIGVLKDAQGNPIPAKKDDSGKSPIVDEFS